MEQYGRYPTVLGLISQPKEVLYWIDNRTTGGEEGNEQTEQG